MAHDRKAAVVTGGAVGIGRAIAETLQRDGFEVAILGRREDRLKAAAATNIRPYVCDVADAGAVGATFGRIRAELGRIDALINNAGVIRGGELVAASDDDIRYQIDVNLLGSIYCTRAAIAPLKESRGCIVNLSSALAKMPLLGTSVYAATKGAIETFTRAMAVELGTSGVRVNAIAPGLVRSEIYLADGLSPAAYEAALKEFSAKYLLGRAGEPADVAELVAYLVSDRAGWITGAVLPVDSGYSNVGFRPA